MPKKIKEKEKWLPAYMYPRHPLYWGNPNVVKCPVHLENITMECPNCRPYKMKSKPKKIKEKDKKIEKLQFEMTSRADLAMDIRDVGQIVDKINEIIERLNND